VSEEYHTFKLYSNIEKLLLAAKPMSSLALKYFLNSFKASSEQFNYTIAFATLFIHWSLESNIMLRTFRVFFEVIVTSPTLIFTGAL
jgi:hypothetical protein